MADTFSNDLRLRLQESGANSGQWGSLLNDTITNIASAFSLGSEAIPNASTHTITLADDSSSGDEARSLFLKCTGGGQACTVTLAPNTVSKVWIISNETSFTLTFSAGSGANVAVAAGAVKVIVTDGAGSGAAVVDAFTDLHVNGLTSEVDGNTAALTVRSTDADATVGPLIVFDRLSSSPADSDVLGRINFNGQNDASEEITYAQIDTIIEDASDGTEDAQVRFRSITAGTARSRLEFLGAETVFNESSRDINFRVESDSNTHMLFVDAGNNRVGVGASSPNANLHISSAGDATNPALQFGGTTTYRLGMYTDSEGGYIENKNGDNGLIFRVKTIGEAMRIAGGTGNVGIGTSSPQANMQVLGTLKVATGNAQGILGLGEGAGTTVNVGLWRGAANNPTSDGNFLNLGGYDGIVFAASNAAIGSQSERMRITAAGYVNAKGNVATTNAPDTQGLHFGWNYSNGAGESLIVFNKGAGSTGGLTFVDNSSSGTHDEVMRLEGGALLVGKTADDNSVGFKTNTSSTNMVANTTCPAFINRLGNVGDLLEFRQDSSTVGSIGTVSGSLSLGSGDCYLEMSGSGNVIQPMGSVTGAASDGVISLGASGRRFQDLRLSGIMYSGTALINTTTSRSGAAVNVRAGSGAIQVIFQNSATTTIGYIGNVSDSSTLYSTSSDERLKENITNADDSGSKIDAIQVRQFDWKVNGLHQDYGMVAQELKAVAPDAVFEPENADDMMGVDYSKLVPMLVKEIQSLRARVAQLETEE